jgi:hypothetical protein
MPGTDPSSGARLEVELGDDGHVAAPPSCAASARTPQQNATSCWPTPTAMDTRSQRARTPIGRRHARWVIGSPRTIPSGVISNSRISGS